MSTQKKILRVPWVVVAALAAPFAPGVVVAVYNTLAGKTIGSVDGFSAMVWANFWKWVTDYVPSHPVRALWFSAVVVFLWVFFSNGLPFIKRAWRRRILFQRVGIRGYLPRETDADKKASWSDCVQFLSDPGNDTICILGANGWETFGAPKAPLHSLLERFGGSVRILLVHPFSDSLDMRAASIGADIEHYRSNIFQSLGFCRTLRRKGLDVSVRLSDWPPVWKMIMSRDRLWLQHYKHGEQVDDTPVYSFGREPMSSLYHPFRLEFQRMWDRAESVEIHLSDSVLRRALASRPLPTVCGKCDGTPAGRLGQTANDATDLDTAKP